MGGLPSQKKNATFDHGTNGLHFFAEGLKVEAKIYGSVLRDLPKKNRALFGLVSYNDPCKIIGFCLVGDFFTGFRTHGMHHHHSPPVGSFTSSKHQIAGVCVHSEVHDGQPFDKNLEFQRQSVLHVQPFSILVLPGKQTWNPKIGDL